jgi:hypothetical protein
MDLTLVPLNVHTREWLTPEQSVAAEFMQDTVFSPGEFIKLFQKFERYQVEVNSDMNLDDALLEEHTFNITIIEKTSPGWHPEPLDVAWVFSNGFYSCAFPDGPVEYALSFSQFIANSFGACFLYPFSATKMCYLLTPRDDEALLRSAFSEWYQLRDDVGIKIF